MVMKQPTDAAVRLAAVDPSRSFVVQAPAGSGKTELLTDRILALLATVNRPEEIVAITFTRKAASEMHARVLSKLEDARQPCPDEEYRRNSWLLARQALQRNEELGWDLLQYPARLSIRTIDAFCSHLVRAMPVLSQAGGLPGIAEQPRVHYEAAARATLALIDDVPAVATLVEHLDVHVQTATQMLADMLGRRDQWLPLLAHGSDLVQLMENLDLSVHEELEELAACMPMGWAQALSGPLRMAADVLAAEGDTALQEALQGWDGEAFNTGPDSVQQWQALAGMLLTQKGELRKTINKRQGFPPQSAHKKAVEEWLRSVDPDASWVEALSAVTCIPEDGYTAEQQEIIAVLIQVLWLAAGQLQRRFTETAEVDFIEISLRAIQALGEPDQPTDLLLTLDNVIRHILVDEFQDTSQSQINLLTRLTAGWMRGDGRTLFLVGDPMQSIYRFREAEVGWFLRVKEEGLGNVRLEPLELTNNFRSQGQLVEAVNRLCGPVFPKADHVGLGAIRYTPSVAFQDPVAGRDVHFHPVWLAKKASPDDVADCTARVDAKVVALAREALQRYPDSDHPVAILVRARSHLNEVVLRLTQAGLPCRAVDLVSLRSRQVVIDMVQLARALSHPADRLAWVSVLRSPLCGLSLAALHELLGHDHDSTVPALLRAWLSKTSGLPEAERDVVQGRRLRYVAQVLLDSSNESGTLPFAVWLERCWNRLGGPSIYGSESDRADAESLLQLIEELAPYGNLNPAELESSLDQLYAAPKGSGRAVEVMTIHKAKGLEFESVILMGLHSRSQADRAPLIRFEQSEGRLLLGPVKRTADDAADPVSRYLSEREKKRAAYEVDRLLYVAMTRPRSELHLVAQVVVDEAGVASAPVATSLLARLWPELSAQLDTRGAFQDGAGPDEGLTTGDNNRSGMASGKQRYLVRPAASVPIPEIRNPRSRAGSTGTQGQKWVWRTHGQDERVLGTVAHAWLERMGRDGLQAWSMDRLDESRPAFRRQLSRAGLAEERLDEAVDTLHDTLASTMKSERGRWLLQVAQAHREWALLDLSGRVSIIDLAISQEDNWLVVDYKTGLPADNESLEGFARRMQETHRVQLDRYCAHVSALDGRPARAALFFPRVDLWVDC